MEEVEGVLSVEGEEEAVTAVVAVEEEEEEEVVAAVVAVEEEAVVVVEEEKEGTVLVMTKSPVRRRRRLLQAFIARTCFLLLLGIFKNFGKNFGKKLWKKKPLSGNSVHYGEGNENAASALLLYTFPENRFETGFDGFND